MPALAALNAPNTTVAPPLLEVLLIEDSEFDRVRIRRLSDALPIPVNLTEATSIAQMEEHISEQRFDLILLDYHLGDGDGLQAMRLIKQAPLQHSAGIVMVTGNEKVEIATSAFRDGCDDFMAKSTLTATTFAETIERVLEKRSMRDAPQLSTGQLRAEISGAVLASLRGQEAQTVISAAVKAAHSSRDEAGLAASEITYKVIALEEEDEFRYI